MGGEGRGDVPLLYFVEAWKKGDWDEDDVCLLAVAGFELWVERCC